MSIKRISRMRVVAPVTENVDEGPLGTQGSRKTITDQRHEGSRRTVTDQRHEGSRRTITDQKHGGNVITKAGGDVIWKTSPDTARATTPANKATVPNNKFSV